MTPAAIILAAGAARRMGSPKQVLSIDGLPMVVRALRTAEGAGLRPVVVLGAHREVVEAALPRDTDRAFNPDWDAGMGGSIAVGLRRAMRAPTSDATVMLCDQPFVTSADLKRLRDGCQGSEVDASAAYYGDRLGVPACFSPRCFEQILALAPHEGARALLRGGGLRTAAVPMPAAAFDIDTPDDVARLLKEKGSCV